MAFEGDKKVGASLLAGPESRLRDWLLPYVPRGVETYHLTLFTFGFNPTNEVFSVDIHKEESQLAVRQSFFFLDQVNRTYEQVQTWTEPITEATVTGQIVFRISLDDATNRVQ